MLFTVAAMTADYATLLEKKTIFVFKIGWLQFLAAP